MGPAASGDGSSAAEGESRGGTEGWGQGRGQQGQQRGGVRLGQPGGAVKARTSGEKTPGGRRTERGLARGRG